MRSDKEYSEWRRKDFDEVPHREWAEDIGVFDSMVIIPTRRIHDSGYSCMDFVAIREGKPVARLSGCSDVIHIDGIGGFGHRWMEKYNGVPKLVSPKAWSIDCLYPSGLLRIFNTRGHMTCGEALSSFEIYVDPDNGTEN